jgi:hypothetical protein
VVLLGGCFDWWLAGTGMAGFTMEKNDVPARCPWQSQIEIRAQRGSFKVFEKRPVFPVRPAWLAWQPGRQNE